MVNNQLHLGDEGIFQNQNCHSQIGFYYKRRKYFYKVIIRKKFKFWDKVINQNKMDSALISELSDLSSRSIGGKRQELRRAKKDIENIGTTPLSYNNA